MRRHADDAGHPLGAPHGPVVTAAADAILKALLEAEHGAAMLAVPGDGSFIALARLMETDVARAQARLHDLALVTSANAGRALDLGAEITARGNGAAAVALSARDLAPLRDDIDRILRPPSGALLLLLEDDPACGPASCPTRLAEEIGLPLLVAGSIPHLRDLVVAAIAIAQAQRGPVALSVHHELLHSIDTWDAHPNRADDSAPAIIARAERAARPPLHAESDALRAIRRLEINHFEMLPSPGERVPLGFVTVGPAREALLQVLASLSLAGRVPRLTLGAVVPADPVALERMLARCEHVVVLEPRPGATVRAFAGIPERLRARGMVPARLSFDVLEDGDPDTARRIRPDDVRHPSRLARLLLPLLHTLRPGARIAERLAAAPPPVPALRADARSAGAPLRRATRELERLVLRAARGLRPAPGDDTPTPAPVFSAAALLRGTAPPNAVPVEIVSDDRFGDDAGGLVPYAAASRRAWLILVPDLGRRRVMLDPMRAARAAIPDGLAERVRLEEAHFHDHAELAARIAAALGGDRLTVLVVRDRAPARFRDDADDAQVDMVDQLGFEPLERVRWSLERSAGIRDGSASALVEHRDDAANTMPRHELRLDRIGRGVLTRPILRVRPLLEEVEVRRIRSPGRRPLQSEGVRLPLPEFIHRRSAVWRLHMAGVRADPPGPVGLALLEAGRLMGYRVRAAWDPTRIGPRRSRWLQVVFTRQGPGEAPAAHATRTPFGEADLVLGLDPIETLAALTVDADLRVADPTRTGIVADLGLSSREPAPEAAREAARLVPAQLEALSLAARRHCADLSELSRAAFHTDRMSDAIALGIAWQSGLIPLTIDAIERGLTAAEATGHEQLRTAFDLGRRVAEDPRIARRTAPPPVDDPVRIARRFARFAYHIRGGRCRRLEQEAAERLRRAIRDLPGLAESDAGRQALIDFAAGFVRCVAWGGPRHAMAFADRVQRLYARDHGERGRELTCLAILPLATVMLPTDALYLACLATGPEHRRRMRQRLDVQRARGDEVSRRYLTRIELIALGFRFRAVLRTSDWPSRLAARLRPIVPDRWRGTERDRALARWVIGLVEQAIAGADDDPARWAVVLGRLHALVRDERWRTIQLIEARLLVEGAADEARPALDGTEPVGVREEGPEAPGAAP